MIVGPRGPVPLGPKMQQLLLQTRPIHDRFLEFHKANPHIYRGLVDLSRAWKQSGRDRLGIAMLWERFRWELAMETSGDLFKLNNDYRSHYARLIMEQEPDLEGIFETRRLRA
jgi:hypothetical protein